MKTITEDMGHVYQDEKLCKSSLGIVLCDLDRII